MSDFGYRAYIFLGGWLMQLSHNYLHGSGGCEKPRVPAAVMAKLKKFGTP